MTPQHHPTLRVQVTYLADHVHGESSYAIHHEVPEKEHSQNSSTHLRNERECRVINLGSRLKNADRKTRNQAEN
jgi:hypothetical protein